ncbi:IS1249 family transposase [Arcanobacterium phocae]|uniref:IS1249 family transposase n=1 Tax=Arcanobacterium phocae TaxID=131112 RepID=UPI00264699C1|nr:IS1249 family transposase [Arcanobacterium phocae]
MRSNKKHCPTCGEGMVKNGKDKCGHQRWICHSCKVTSRWHNDVTSRDLRAFLDVLTGKTTQRELPGQGRTFRRKSAVLWEIWPICEPDGQAHRVIHVDGIHLGRDAVILIACSPEYVIAWHVARRESTQAWLDLLAKIPPPGMVVADGGTGFTTARTRLWPSTRVQRCTFHAYQQVKRYTTTRSRTECGRQLYRIGVDLLHVKTPAHAHAWINSFYAWRHRWAGFLAEKTRNEKGKLVDKHERLVKAGNSLSRLVDSGHLFTFLNPDLYDDGEIIGSLPAMNNQIEGGINSPLRELLRRHRGMSIDHRIRAVLWWCYLHTENPANQAEILRIMPTNTDITRAYQQAAARHRAHHNNHRWGNGLDWNELHTHTPYRNDY